MTIKLPLSLKGISEIVDGEIIGDANILVKRLNRIEDCEKGDLTFYASPKYEKYLAQTKASCIIVSKEFIPVSSEHSYIKVANPHFAFMSILKELNTKKIFPHSIHKSAVIGNGTIINPNSYIGPNCSIGENCQIEENVVLMTNVVLYDNVKIGKNSILHGNVVCYYDTLIGENCIIHAGTVIGSDGFGFTENPDHSWDKIPQLGNVVIGNNVEIGANTTIDRALLGSTIIENGVKIDNLVQIAHNVLVGENSAMAAQTGISGSTKIGKRNRFGGQVGLAGHLETPDDVVIEAQSGVAKSISEKGIYFGSPIKERLKAFRIEVAINQLPDLIYDFRKLKKLVESLTKSNEIK